MSGMLGGESVSSPFQWEEDSGDSTASSLLLDTVLQDTIDTDRWALIGQLAAILGCHWWRWRGGCNTPLSLVSWSQYSALIGQLAAILSSHWSAAAILTSDWCRDSSNSAQAGDTSPASRARERLVLRLVRVHARYYTVAATSAPGHLNYGLIRTHFEEYDIPDWSQPQPTSNKVALLFPIDNFVSQIFL